MRKIALSVTAATLILSGLAGCGDVNDTGMNDGQRGYSVNHRNGYNVGDGRYNHDGNIGQNNNRGFDQGGIFGQNEGRRAETHGSYGFNQGREYVGNNQNRGFGNTNDNRGLGQRNGYNYQENEAGTHGLNRGARGQNRVTGFHGRGNSEYRGFGRGIVGNDRPGMVDKDGLLNGQRANVTGQNRYNDNQGLKQIEKNRNQNQSSNFRSNDGRRSSNNGVTGFNNRQDDHIGQNRALNQSGRKGTTQQSKASGYYNGEDGRLARRISKGLGQDNVRNSHVVVNGDNVIIAVDNDGKTRIKEDDIRKKVGNVRDDLNVHVVTERDQVRQVRGMSDRLDAGEAFEEIGATFNEMLNDLGNAASRPFQRSR